MSKTKTPTVTTHLEIEQRLEGAGYIYQEGSNKRRMGLTEHYGQEVEVTF